MMMKFALAGLTAAGLAMMAGAAAAAGPIEGNWINPSTR